MNNNTEPTRIRPFASFLQEHGRGRTHDELGETLHALVSRVKDTGKKGTVTLMIEVKPLKEDDRAVIVTDKITVKLPEHDRPAGVWFVGHDGNLQKNDPDQDAFQELREVPLPGVDTTTGEVIDKAAN